jgi:hypothetical protein
MVMRDEQGVYITDVPAVSAHSGLGAFAGDARIKKQTYPAGLHIDAVPVGTALQ